ncbi:MAG: O-methyltransferase [Myxococcota bacterium]
MPRDIGRRTWMSGSATLSLLPLLACRAQAGAPKPGSAAPGGESDTSTNDNPPPSSPPGASADDGALSLVGSSVAAYCDDHTVPQSPAMRAIYEETRASEEMWIMMIGAVEAALLRLMVQLTGAKRVLEVGTFTGYSAIAMAEGLPSDGKLITLDISERWTAIAKKHWASSAHGNKIELRLGPAADTLATLKGPFDVAFIDADKSGYPGYWDAIVPMMRRGGLVICDNVLAGGRVAAPDGGRAATMHAFNEKVSGDTRVAPIFLPVRDGVSISRVL